MLRKLPRASYSIQFKNKNEVAFSVHMSTCPFKKSEYKNDALDQTLYEQIIAQEIKSYLELLASRMPVLRQWQRITRLHDTQQLLHAICRLCRIDM